MIDNLVIWLVVVAFCAIVVGLVIGWVWLVSQAL